MKVTSSEIKSCPICQRNPRRCNTNDTRWPYMLECDGSADDPHLVIYSGCHPRLSEAIDAWNATVANCRLPESQPEPEPVTPSQIVSQASIVVTQTLDGRIYMNSAPLFPMGDTTSYACQIADSMVRMAAAIIAEGCAPGWSVLSEEHSEGAE